jgi:tetratricopeptide (TPR) repeat protein
MIEKKPVRALAPLCYDRRMRPLAAVVAAILAFAAPAAAADALAEARRLYNLGQYDAAEQAAHDAFKERGAAEGARLVLGRIYLERYRRTGDEADLTSGREALTAVDARLLDERERLELMIGTGEALYLEDRFGPAAELFQSALDGGSVLELAAYERLLDWWATALDRLAQTRPRDGREPIYRRVVERMEREVGQKPGSTPASYWLAAAARGSGDIDRAWNAAIAGWVRGPLALDRGAALRADLDRLVVQAIIPERAARLNTPDPRQAIAGMVAEWEAFKTSWSR